VRPTGLQTRPAKCVIVSSDSCHCKLHSFTRINPKTKRR
jgi:hypothetical protein